MSKVNFPTVKPAQAVNFPEGSLGSTLESLACYNENINELIKEFVAKYIDPTTGQFVNVDFNTGVQIVQTLWDKVKETSLECTGSELDINLDGDGLALLLIRTLLSAIGFKI